MLVVAVLLLAVSVVGFGAAPAHAETSGQYANRLTFELTRMDPAVVTDDGPNSVTLTATFTNAGPDPITDIAYRFQRGPRLATTAEVQAEEAKPTEPTTVVGSAFTDLPGTLAPGQSRAFTVTTAVFGEATDALAITEPGVYAVMVNVNATVSANGSTVRARVGELHALVTVTSVPAEFQTEPPVTAPPGRRNVSILWPLVDRPHQGVGGVFLDDDLKGEITGSGRLAAAVTALTDAPVDPALVTLVVDPMLLDEVQQMADGYRLLPAGSQQGRLTATGAIAGSVRGSGQRAATEFLQEIRNLAAIHQVIVLPYGDADIAALMRAGMTAEAAYAVTRGRDAATRVLVRGPDATAIYDNLVTDVALPVDGVATHRTLQVLSAMGDRGAVLAPGSVTDRAGHPVTSGMVAVDTRLVDGRSSAADSAGPGLPAGDADSSAQVTAPGGGSAEPTMTSVISGGAVTDAFAAVLDGSGPAVTARTVGLIAAELVTAPPADRTPIVVVPPRRFTANGAGLTSLAGMINELTSGGTVTPTQVSRLLKGRVKAASQHPTTLAYTPANRAAELPTDYLLGAQGIDQQIDVLRGSLGKAHGGADPAVVLGSLKDALSPAFSAAWRGSSAPAAASLETLDATLVWLYGGVQITRDTGSYTLASSTAPLLLTVRNALPYTVSVEVKIVGGAQSGLAAKGPGVMTIGVGPRSVPVKLATEVSRSGTFTVYAQLYAHGGTAWAGAVPLTIDSRAYGALTVILMSVAGGVLVLMVVWRLVQRLRGKIDDPDDAVLAVEPGSAVDEENHA